MMIANEVDPMTSAAYSGQSLFKLQVNSFGAHVEYSPRAR